MDTGTNTAATGDCFDVEATGVDALEVVDELGTHAVADLNRAHFLLADLEPGRGRSAPRIPSDRWYRLYAQLEQTRLVPCAVYLLSAATLVDEVHVLAERSDKLARHSRRAPVREQVARHLDAVTPWTTQLLVHACLLSQQPEPIAEEDRPAPANHRVFLSYSYESPEGSTDEQIDRLIADIMAGDVSARDDVLTLIHPLVLKYCRARLGRQESLMGSADDVAQDVCMAVLSALPHYQSKGLSFRAFVYGIAAHKVADAFRAIGRNRAEPVADLPDGPVLADGPEPLLLAAERAAQLGTLLGHLTSRQREVIVLRLGIGLSIDEIADAVGSTPGSVRVAQHRGLNRLRELSDVDEHLVRVLDDPLTDAARTAAVARKEALAAEAETLAAETLGAEATQWKQAGDRFKAILDEWRTVRGVDKKSDELLWKRFSKAREAFNRRRGSHFADLDRQRATARARKEELSLEAEKLADSDDWGPTAARFRDLMTEWKAAGRAQKDADDALWQRFRTAQDAFFARRTNNFAERDAEFDTNAVAKRALLDEAEKIDAADPDAARAALRGLQERWEAVGKVPRDDVRPLEARMRAVEEKVREAADRQWRRTDPEAEARVAQFRERVAAFDTQAAKARAAGDARRAAQAQAQADQWREWLATAEQAAQYR